MFVFPGQGSQWGDGSVVVAGVVGVCGAVAECERALAPFVEWSLGDVVAGGVLRVGSGGCVQPVLWAVMVSLAEVWRGFGVVPDVVVGHSQGEIAAACVAGVLSLGDGARVVCVAFAVVGGVGGWGGMAWVGLSVGEVEGVLGVGVGVVGGGGEWSVFDGGFWWGG
ncbi:acyltransferase domain-containing protein [Streptacidiphilus sp. 4-A2]|nr:acyltransferase domain-containing protein [Streptacidiphilus sp. 4-A2]